MGTQPKAMTWAGWVISVLVGLMLTASATMKLMNAPAVAEQMVGKLGYPKDVILVLGIVEVSCVVLYLVPPTAILGAVLMTGYLGGAIATHVRLHDNFFGAAMVGVFVWLGLFLRDPRVRALLPIRRRLTSVESK